MLALINLLITLCGILLSLLCLGIILLTAALVFGGPRSPKPLDSINTPFQNVDYSNLPILQHYLARDGVSLSYRFYQPNLPINMQSVVLIHGSSGNSTSMHLLAQGLARAGLSVYALDIRGHGDSGSKGKIAYIGQLEDDLEDFVKMVNPKSPRTLVGFSSGAGFALRFAGSNRQKLFDRYLLLSPFIHQNAETYKPNSGGWVSVGMPRLIAIRILNHFGIERFNNLDVLAFALNDEVKNVLTPAYSASLAANFQPLDDYSVNILAVEQPISLFAGQNDEVFYADQFEPVFEKAGRPITVTIIPGVGHIGLTLDDAAINAITAAMVH